MTATNFAASLALVLEHEGEWSDHPLDKGGPTMRGVTQATYDSYRRSLGNTPQSVKLISDAELKALFRRDYWDKVRGDDLPPGIDYATFDAAVNSGVSRGAKWLQRAIGVAADGVVGGATIQGAFESIPGVTLNRMAEDRLDFLRGLPTWDTFGKGWSARVEGVRQAAMKMAAAIASEPRPDGQDDAEATVALPDPRTRPDAFLRELAAIMTNP